jgi:hypothetical protein
MALQDAMADCAHRHRTRDETASYEHIQHNTNSENVDTELPSDVYARRHVEWLDDSAERSA